MKKVRMTIAFGGFVLLVILLSGSDAVFAHCDTMDGPVVAAAKKALEAGNVNFILIWVQKKDEGEIKKAFQKTLTVRKMSPEAKDLADMYFFETLVRIHRSGEGAPYTGLKPAGLNLGPAIPAADKALGDGKVDPLLNLITNTVQEGIKEHFKQAMAKKNFNKENVEAGREYIEAYVTFIHYVEAAYEAAKKPVKGHYPEPAESGTHKE